ncbi:hypothetical protein HGA13_16110 [Nocardia speluncae]|uniref:Uncharacterized protein n=1 Tax=Nocardia speluncae TaxID=419477 RepID=A0A846XGJ1_9NOCA|nr:hypothetical protein [Nocardia speluncae]NKY34587.1 hypothetical protein [Nocardia speluncae]
MSDEQIIDRILGALEDVPGLRPAAPLLGDREPWPWDTRKYAVDLGAEVVEMRLVSEVLPLPPLLERAGAAIRAVLTGTRWEQTELRLVVTELDTAAVAGEGADQLGAGA